MSSPLIDLGLTKGEVSIYEALLQLGESTTGPIIAQSGISSSKVYEILERLKQKGLVSQITKNKVKHYLLTSPLKLSEYIKRQEDEVVKRKELLAKYLPVALAQYRATSKSPNAEFFEGLPAIRQMLIDLVDEQKKGSKYCFMSGTGEKYPDALAKVFLALDVRRKERRIQTKGLAHESKRKELAGILAHTTLRFTAIPLPSNISFAGNKVAIQSWTRKPVAVLITSDDIVKQFTVFFESLWKSAKP